MTDPNAGADYLRQHRPPVSEGLHMDDEQPVEQRHRDAADVDIDRALSASLAAAIRALAPTSLQKAQTSAEPTCPHGSTDRG